MTDEAIALLNDKFVPYAPGWGLHNDPKQRQGYEWWKVVAQTTPTFKMNGVSFNDMTVPHTTFYVATAAGRRVPARKAWSEKPELAGTLKRVLRLYADLPERERRPAQPITDANRPKLAPPPGGLCLISYDRPLMRKGDRNNYCSLTGREKDTRAINERRRKRIPHQPGAQLDALWLTREECQSLMPADPRKGQTFAVSPHLVKRIGLYGLTVRSASQEFYFWNAPDSFRHGDLQLTVESVSPTAVEMRLHGAILLEAKGHSIEGNVSKADLKTLRNRYDARLEGKLVYDPGKKRFTRWDMVALGDYTGSSQACDWGRYGEDGRFVTREPLPIAMSFEIDNWNYEKPAAFRRTVPYLFWWFGSRANQGYDYYFSPEKREKEWIKRGKKENTIPR